MAAEDAGGLLCHEELALRWSVVSEGEVALARAAARPLNEERLRVVNTLAEHHRAEAAEEGSALSQELQRLDFKLNLVLEMVGRLLAADNTPPATVAVELGPRHLRWRADPPPAPGQWLRVELYLNARYPFPVLFFGRVDSVDEEGRVRLLFDCDDEAAQGHYEKYLFRCHRRQVARRRAASPSSV